jgi:hypothetical protein
MADANQTESSGWFSGLGDFMDLIGNAVTTGAGAYATIKTADQAAAGQKTAGATAAGATAVQPAGVATNGAGTVALGTGAIIALAAAGALGLGLVVYILAGRRRR